MSNQEADTREPSEREIRKAELRLQGEQYSRGGLGAWLASFASAAAALAPKRGDYGITMELIADALASTPPLPGSEVEQTITLLAVGSDKRCEKCQHVDSDHFSMVGFCRHAGCDCGYFDGAASGEQREPDGYVVQRKRWATDGPWETVPCGFADKKRDAENDAECEREEAGYEARVVSVYFHRPPAPDLKREECEWKPDDEGLYEASCGAAWVIEEGTPEENDCKFCSSCGRIVRVLDEVAAGGEK